MNISRLSDEETARTNIESALQRAENVYILGGTRVLELCVGPSLKVLEEAYTKYNIEVFGNDIDYRWKNYYSQGKWYIGDWKKELAYNQEHGYPANVIVFAPPVTKGCTGKREDSLMIDEVFPSYYDFLRVAFSLPKTILKVIVLPARSISTHQDRQQYHKLLSTLDNYEEVHLTEGVRRIRKYIDIYFY